MTSVPLSLYIHIPWCIRLCPYCDFNSHQAPQDLPEKRYIAALLQDLEQELPSVWGRRLTSIFIGGGTPSLFSAESIYTLLQGIRSLIPHSPQIEITLEANPGTFEQERFCGFREAGINRLSMGIQSFNAEHLKKLGRVHGRQEALNAAQIARQAGFDNFNLDLMYALPEQTQQEAMQDLHQAIELAPTHLSWYQLTLEPNTVFHKYPPTLPEDDQIAEMQLAGQQIMAHSCYHQYEVSAYAREQQKCQHNVNYWEFGDYIGIGAGAHGKLTQAGMHTVMRYQKSRQPADYMQRVTEGQARLHPKILAPKDLIFEFALNALRLQDGFSLALFTQRTTLAASAIQKPLEQAINRQWLTIDNHDHIQTTEQGWRYLNNVMELFLEE